MKYKLTIYPAFEAGNPTVEFKFDSVIELIAAKETCADLLLFIQNETNIMPSYSNMFYMEELIDEDWEKFENEITE